MRKLKNKLIWETVKISSGEGRLNRRPLLVRGTPQKAMTFIMLNPSKADAKDCTIKKCKGFSERLGFSGFFVVNLSAIVINPLELPNYLYQESRVLLHENLRYIWMAVCHSKIVVAAWGALKDKKLILRSHKVLDFLTPVDVYALKITKKYFPRHPLYLKCDLRPVLYSPAFSNVGDKSKL